MGQSGYLSLCDWHELNYGRSTALSEQADSDSNQRNLPALESERTVHVAPAQRATSEQLTITHRVNQHVGRTAILLLSTYTWIPAELDPEGVY